MRWQREPVSGAEMSVADAGMERDPAARAIQHLSRAVLVPATGVAWGIAPAVRSQGEGEQPVQHRMSGFGSSGCGHTVYGSAGCPFPGMLAVRHHGWAGS